MAQREFIAGPNFSGRSAALREALQRDAAAGGTFYIGPYAEAALSGLTSAVRDELLLYSQRSGNTAAFALPIDDDAQTRDPQSLSGGEQVLLALHCFSHSAYTRIAIDTALEQLDPANRAAALSRILASTRRQRDPDRQPHAARSHWTITQQPPASPAFVIDWPKLARAHRSRRPPRALPSATSISAIATANRFLQMQAVTLEPGHAYRVAGANGAGKTTLFKLLVGALVPDSAEMTARRHALPAVARRQPRARTGDSEPRPAMVRRDARRGHGAAAQGARRQPPSVNRLLRGRVRCASAALGVASLDAHLYELPLLARASG